MFRFIGLTALLWAGQLVQASPSQAVEIRDTGANGSLKTYPIPSGVDISTAFDVKVRVAGGQWQNISSYKPLLAEINTTTGSMATKASSMAYFDFNGTVEISATYKNGAVKAAKIRPYSYGIPTTMCGAAVRFTLSEPRNVFLQVNDEIFDGLHLFTNAFEDNVPSRNDSNVVYFEPGLHDLKDPLTITSGQTVYVPGGSVVRVSAINIANATDVTIRGRGVLLFNKRSDINVARSQRVTIEGVTGINVLPRVYESRDVAIVNFRAISASQWGDGIDVYSSRNVFIDRNFLRNSDDCVAIYNHRDEWYGDTVNVTVQNSALWADVAHPVNIGTHGNTQEPEVTDGIVLRNIDIMDHREMQVDYQGCIALNPGDSNMLQNVLIEDVRVEDFRLGQLINMRIMYNKKYNTSPGRGIRNVTIRNFSYTGTRAYPSLLVGYDEKSTIEFITFQNLTINGVAIYDTMKKPGWYATSDEVPMYVNEHVKNLTFIQ